MRDACEQSDVFFVAILQGWVYKTQQKAKVRLVVRHNVRGTARRAFFEALKPGLCDGVSTVSSEFGR